MDWLAFFIFLAASGAAAATGSMFQPGQWYEGLNKPSWTPPKLAFPIVWTILYILIAVAAARVVHLPGAGYALAFWALQIALNTLWTPIFFGLRDMKAGMVVILMLWVAVLCTLISLMQIDMIAGLMFVPYLIWVSIASALNYSVMTRNPDLKPLRD